MTIGIDASRANRPNRTGVEWYAFHLIQELKALTAGDKHTWILYTREPLKGDLAVLPENWYEVRAGWPPKRMWTQVRMSWEMLRRPVDVLFVPAHVLPIIHPEKSVVTVHDVGFRRFPHLYTNANRSYHEASTRGIAKTDARIITVSAHAGREIAELYGVNTRRIAVTPCGVDHTMYRPGLSRAEVEARLRTYRLAQPFFLAVGRLETKKNTANLVRAFTEYKKRRGEGDPTQLVLVGTPGRGYEQVKAAIAASPFATAIHELGYVPEEDLPFLMNAARALVHVSWYEGFGIPPVQAMACGCPVVAADNSCMPEVLGEGNALFVPPGDLNAIVHALDQLDMEPGLAERLRERGIRQAAQYTWRATAEATLPVLTQWLGTNG
ncbi:MAG: hypothetical protein RL141_686 [Candidatus Parcubacteria bacterium]|jgi:glycosyltransferase involved in cell wall biosynthesis